MAESFAQIVGVLMRDQNFRTLALGELDWMVIPPVLANQFALAHAAMPQTAALEAKADKGQDSARVVPVAVALWARVSPNIDKALSESPDKQLKLSAADWTSGNNVWIMALAGNQKAFPKFLEQLVARDFKGQQVKMRVRDRDGKAVVRTLGQSA
jgi:hemolysin-activating ACP:hemolysin acyltransferase